MDISEPIVTVKEAFFTVSGLMFAVIEWNGGILNVGTSLRSENHQQWLIIEAASMMESLKKIALQAGGSDDTWFFYKLQPNGHNMLPKVNSKLLTIPPGS